MLLVHVMFQHLIDNSQDKLQSVLLSSLFDIQNVGIECHHIYLMSELFYTLHLDTAAN